jgi:hypothetical protein
MAPFLAQAGTGSDANTYITICLDIWHVASKDLLEDANSNKVQLAVIPLGNLFCHLSKYYHILVYFIVKATAKPCKLRTIRNKIFAI